MGEIPLFSVRFKILVLDAHFTELAANPNELDLPFDAYSRKVQGALIRSHPISRKLPHISRFRDVIRYVPAQYERYYIDVKGSFAD